MDDDNVSNSAGLQSSTFWVMTTYVAQQATRLAANLVLTRLLLPEDFALIALAFIVILGCEMLSDVGLRPSVLRHTDSEKPHFYRTAWTLQICRGLILCVVVLALAVPMSELYDAPQLKYLLFALAVVPVIQGFESIGVLLAERRLEYYKVFRALIMEPVVMAPVGITLAWLTGSVWALAVMIITAAAVRTIAGHIIFRDTPMGFHLNREAAWELIHFGKWVVLSSALTFLLFQADRLSLGKLGTLATLGLYSVALMWSEVPLQAVRNWINSVFQPLLSRWRRSAAEGNGESPADRSSRYRSQVVLVAAIPFGMGLGLSEAIMNLMYDDTFAKASTFLMILLFSSWLGLLEELYAPMLFVWGYPNKRMYACLLGAIVFAVLAYPFFKLWGAHGIAFARVASVFMLLVAQWWMWRAESPQARISKDLLATVVMGITAAGMWYASRLVTGWIGEIPATLLLLTVMFATFAVVIAKNRDRLFTNPGA